MGNSNSLWKQAIIGVTAALVAFGFGFYVLGPEAIASRERANRVLVATAEPESAPESKGWKERRESVRERRPIRASRGDEDRDD